MGGSTIDNAPCQTVKTVLLWNLPKYSRAVYIRDLLQHDRRVVVVEFHGEQRILQRIRKLRQLFLVKDLLKLRVLYRPNTMVVFSPVPSSILGVILGRLLGIPIVFDLYYSWVESQLDAGIWSEKGVRTQLGRFLEGALLRSAKFILVDTHANKEYFSKVYRIPDRRIRSIYGVVDLDKFNPRAEGKAVRTKYHLGSCPVIMYHGSFQHVHGVDRVIRLIPLVVEKAPNAKFLLVGMGPTYYECRRLVKKLNLEEAIVFTGRVKHNVLPEYLACCDVWLGMFSLGEKAQRTARFGMFEAMALGKPVVTAKTREAENVLTDGVDGFLVNPEDLEEIAEIVVRLVKNRKLQVDVGGEARKCIETSFSLREMEKTLLSCLEEAEAFQDRS